MIDLNTPSRVTKSEVAKFCGAARATAEHLKRIKEFAIRCEEWQAAAHLRECEHWLRGVHATYCLAVREGTFKITKGAKR